MYSVLMVVVRTVRFRSAKASKRVRLPHYPLKLALVIVSAIFVYNAERHI